jgi:hypothetical protein
MEARLFLKNALYTLALINNGLFAPVEYPLVKLFETSMEVLNVLRTLNTQFILKLQLSRFRALKLEWV